MDIPNQNKTLCKASLKHCLLETIQKSAQLDIKTELQFIRPAHLETLALNMSPPLSGLNFNVKERQGIRRIKLT